MHLPAKFCNFTFCNSFWWKCKLCDNVESMLPILSVNSLTLSPLIDWSLFKATCQGLIWRLVVIILLHATILYRLIISESHRERLTGHCCLENWFPESKKPTFVEVKIIFWWSCWCRVYLSTKSNICSLNKPIWSKLDTNIDNLRPNNKIFFKIPTFELSFKKSAKFKKSQ